MNEGGVSRYSVKVFVSHRTENLRRGTFLCFTKSLVSAKFMDKRGGGGRLEYHDILSKIFCLTVPKNFVGELLCVSQSFWYRNNLCIRRGRTEGVSRYSVKFFCLSVPKNLVGEFFYFLQNFSYRKTLWIRGWE